MYAFCSEEVFDFSSGQMTQAKAKHLKDTMCGEFSEIFQLCNFVMVIGTIIYTVDSMYFHIGKFPKPPSCRCYIRSMQT